MGKVAAIAVCALMACAASADVRMRNVASRGVWSAAVPANTVEAVKAAYAAGATCVEVDVHHTAAGQMVCVRSEAELKKATGCGKKIRDLTPADVASLDLGAGAGLSRPYRIPTLERILAVVPKSCVVQTEIKGYSAAFADMFDKAVKEAGLLETNVVVSSFRYDALKDFKGRYPAYRAIWLVGLTKPVAGKPFEVQQYVAQCKAAKVDVFCPGCAGTKGGMKPSDVAALRAAGIEFRVNRVDSPDDLRQAKALGAAGFTTSDWKGAFAWAAEIGGVVLLK